MKKYLLKKVLKIAAKADRDSWRQQAGSEDYCPGVKEIIRGWVKEARAEINNQTKPEG